MGISVFHGSEIHQVVPLEAPLGCSLRFLVAPAFVFTKGTSVFHLQVWGELITF